MINAVSDIGVLLLLLLIGMETDLALVKHVHRTAAITSAAGIVIPFGCGYVLREMLPDIAQFGNLVGRSLSGRVEGPISESKVRMMPA
jgi:Kef-type K+ transport system membrane component KefB